MISWKRLTIILLLLLFVFVKDSLFVFGELKCIEKEREALLRFKQDLIDEGDILSSWGVEDDKKECCQWKGIKCSNYTGHVVALQLSCQAYSTQLGGKINNALLQLNHLIHLDLSYNDFGSDEIPRFIGSLKRLQHLNLASSYFSGVVPYQLVNLTNLRTLDLGHNELAFENSSSSYFKRTNLLQDILNLPFLTELYLSECRIPTYFIVNSSSDSLRILDLSWTGLQLDSSLHHWVFNITTNLRSINVSSNDLEATIPDEFGRFTFLEHLDLSDNLLTGGIPKSLGNLSHLRTLILSRNNLSEPVPQLFYKLSVRANESLEVLKLDRNKLHGSLPDLSLFSSLRIFQFQGNQLNGSFPDNFGQLSKLEFLDLSANQITGSVPDLRVLNASLKELHLSSNKMNILSTSLGHLSKLEVLDVSFNSLQGTISDIHLLELQNLRVLDLSFNSLVLNFTADWVPPFQLQVVRLASCNVGPSFPTWLQSQTKFSELDLSCASMSGEVPNWLWDSFPRIRYLNLSHNHMSGRIPGLSSSFIADDPIFDISYNNFSGHLPLFHSNTLILQLSNNMFQGSVSSICTSTPGTLMALDLSHNQLSGELPNCWENMTGLLFLNLANNKLSGHIPDSLGSLDELQSLSLRNNNFSGELPSTLKNCKDLVMFDVRGNRVTGTVPAWIGTHLTVLSFLSLGHNIFYGSIPQEICYLTEIQVLDLSRNAISGIIPRCLNNITSFVQRNKTISDTALSFLYYSYEFSSFIDNALVQWKGQEAEYIETLQLLKLIDLSSNRLVGNIPPEFSHLRALISLNLSRNYLNGNMLSDIGQMEMLECLDLSGNQFFGKIPIGLTELHFLAVLDLSNNSFSGRIPSSTQLQSFDPSVYAGNRELCGRPLMSCPGDDPNPSTNNHGKQENIADEEDDGFIAQFLSDESYISIILGFIVGFWEIVGTLVLNDSWRNAYFNLFSRIGDWLYVTTTIYAGRLRRSLRTNART